MTTEFLGAAILSAGGLIAGIASARELTLNAKRILEAENAIKALERAICGRLAPLEAAVENAMHEQPECSLIERFAVEAQRRGYENAPDCWVAAATDCGLSPEAAATASELAAVLGRYDGDEQRQMFETVCARLEHLYAEAKNKSRTLGRACVTLGACGGAMLALVLM